MVSMVTIRHAEKLWEMSGREIAKSQSNFNHFEPAYRNTIRRATDVWKSDRTPGIDIAKSRCAAELWKSCHTAEIVK